MPLFVIMYNLLILKGMNEIPLFLGFLQHYQP